MITIRNLVIVSEDAAADMYSKRVFVPIMKHLEKLNTEMAMLSDPTCNTIDEVNKNNLFTFAEQIITICWSLG